MLGYLIITDQVDDTSMAVMGGLFLATMVVGLACIIYDFFRKPPHK